MSDEVSVFPSNPRDVFQCRYCDKISKHCCHISQEMEICCECGKDIANRWWEKHSGRWLTYPNSTHPKQGFKKQLIPEQLRWQVFERDEFRCRHCSSRTMLRADHIIAESKGGDLVLDNLQTLCNRCNSKKGNR